MQSRLDRFVWKALIEPGFCEQLLTGDRRSALESADLSDEERQLVMEIEADTLEELAEALSSGRAYSFSKSVGILPAGFIQ